MAGYHDPWLGIPPQREADQMTEITRLRTALGEAVRTGLHARSCGGWDAADDAKCNCWKAHARAALGAMSG